MVIPTASWPSASARSKSPARTAHCPGRSVYCLSSTITRWDSAGPPSRMTIDPALALTERLEDRRSPVRQGRSAARRRETSRWRKREALGVRRSRHRRSLLGEVFGVKGVGPHRGRLDAHEDDALAPLERARAVDVAPDRFDLVDPFVVATDERGVPMDDDADRVAVHVGGAARRIGAQMP